MTERPTRPAAPAARLLELISGKLVTHAISVAARLRIADLLCDGPRTSDEIAARLSIDPDAAYRLLRALATIGLFEERDDRRFELLPLGDCIRTDTPGSLADLAVMFGEPWHSAAWAELPYSVATGKNAFEHAHGKPLFEYLSEHAEAAEVFHRAMSQHTANACAALIGAYDFASSKVVVDVGGGDGTLLRAILQASPDTRGILFESSSVAETMRAKIAESDVGARCEVVGGDFLLEVPAGHDRYLLKQVLHDWDDERAAKILENCRRQMVGGGRVLIVEVIVSPVGTPSFGKTLDLEMLVLTHGGRERTRDEYEHLLGLAGLRITRVLRTASLFSIIEAAV